MLLPDRRQQYLSAKALVKSVIDHSGDLASRRAVEAMVDPSRGVGFGDPVIAEPPHHDLAVQVDPSGHTLHTGLRLTSW